MVQVGERERSADRAAGVRRDAGTPRRIDPLLLVPLLCPAVLLAAGNDAFGFDPPGWLDSFTFLGYFWHYPEHLSLFDANSNYKISRLPWILPGFAAHTLFPPLVAARILAYGALTSAALAIYLHVRDATRDRHTAAFVSVLLACCTGLHAPGGWYYHTLAAAGFYLWACWMFTRAAAAPNPGAWAAGAGACFAAAVHTHLFLAVFAPLPAVLYWGARPPHARRGSRWGTTVASALAGGLALTAILAIVNRSTGGAWLFFLPQVEIALRLSEGDRWWLPVDRWLPQATYLVIPLALIAAGLLSGGAAAKPDARLKRTLIALPCLALGITCIFQFWTRETTLDYDYMAFVLYLHALPAAAPALWWPAAPTRRHGLAANAAAVVLLPLVFLMPSGIPETMTQAVQRLGWAQLPRIVPPLLFALAGVAIARVLPRHLRVVAVAVWFSTVNAWTAPQPAAYGVHTPGIRQEMLETFREADAFTHRLDPTLRGIKYWMSTEELPTPYGPVPSQQVFDSFVATRAWLANLFARKSPGPPIETLTVAQLSASPCLGILSSQEQQAALADAMVAHYATLDRPLRIVAKRAFEREEFGFALTVLASPDVAAGSSGNPQPCASGVTAR